MKKTLLIEILFFLSGSAIPQDVRSEKRGIAYGHHSEADIAAISGGVSWWYNWYRQPESGVAGVYQNYDMILFP